MSPKRNGIRTKFLKDAFNNLFKTNLPKNKIQPTNDKPPLQQRQSTRKSQQTTNITSSKNKNSSSSQRSSKGSQNSLTDVEIFVDSSSSSAIKAKRLSGPKGTQQGMQMSLPGRTSRSSSASPKVEAKTKSSASPSAASGTKLSASPSAAKKKASSASSTAKIGLENMDALSFDIILKELFKKEKSFVLDFNYLEKIKKMSMILALSLNPLLKKLELQPIETYLLPNIITINLTHNVIDEYTLNILNLTVKYSKVTTIILRNITFEDDDIADKFLQYLQKNTQIKRLILRNISMDNYLNRLVDIIGKLTNITLLEFSNFHVNTYFHNSFLRTLIKLKNLKHLIFNNNNISSNSYGYIFSGEYQLRLPKSVNVYHVGGVLFIDNFVIITNFYDKIINKQYKYDNRMTIYSNFSNLNKLDDLAKLDGNDKFKQMNSLNFHAYGNYYPINKHEHFFSNSNVSESNLDNYTSASIQNIMNKLESELGVPNLSFRE